MLGMSRTVKRLWLVSLQLRLFTASSGPDFSHLVSDLLSSLSEKPASQSYPRSALEVSYNEALQPLVNVSIGGQWLRLVFDASSADAIAFVKEYNACMPTGLEPCYSYKVAEKHGSLHVCKENNAPQAVCDSRPDLRFKCTKYLQSLANASTHDGALAIDGLEYYQKSVEAIDSTMIELAGVSKEILSWSNVPVRLLKAPLSIKKRPPNISLDLFVGADGILGASGPRQSCRNATLWSLLLKSLGSSQFAFDFRAPPAAVIREPGPSRIVFNEIDPDFTDKLLWSEPKQTGDAVNDALHELVIFRPQVCGVDLLYNASSNWLTIIDTSGPCLALPPFLFDRVMTHIPADCPFSLGQKSGGRLCSPRRVDSNSLLPSFRFQLHDASEPAPPVVDLPLERLVFRNSSGDELLCVARQDMNPKVIPADMMYSHIALGSMAVAALYTVVDLKANSIGFAPRGNPSVESSEAGCAAAPECIAMQTFFPPLNLCEDPPCGDYMLMALDENMKTCRWKTAVPAAFVALLLGLASLDLLSHRLYKSVIRRASEFNQ